MITTSHTSGPFPGLGYGGRGVVNSYSLLSTACLGTLTSATSGRRFRTRAYDFPKPREATLSERSDTAPFSKCFLLRELTRFMTP